MCLLLLISTDIDECMMQENVCDKFVSCTNIEGSYTCQCTQEDGSDCITSEFRGHFVIDSVCISWIKDCLKVAIICQSLKHTLCVVIKFFT